MNQTAPTFLASQDSPGDQDEPGSPADADLPPESVQPKSDHSEGEPELSNGVEVLVSSSEAIVGIDIDWIAAHLRQAIALIDRPIKRLSISVIDDAEMTRLHLRHCEIDSTTDVLTFPMSAPSQPVEADIAVCAEVAVRNAAERGHNTERELLLYAIHGMLHCVGFDDHTEADYKAMHAEEDRLLEAIGVGAIFRSPGRDRQ